MSNIPPSLTLVKGACAPDGGSVLLEGLDPHSRRISIYLDWSHDAQSYGATSLDADGKTVPKRTLEEQKWLELIASATIVPENAAEYSPAQNEGVTAAIAQCRHDLIEKVHSLAYTSKAS